MKLYRFALSGHSHRAELFLSLLGVTYEKVDIDLLKGEQKHAAFLQKNAFGEVPVLEDGDNIIADSNAILVWLAMKYDTSKSWYPQAVESIAGVQRWLSVASGRLAYSLNHLRMIKAFGMQMYNLEQASVIAESTLHAMQAHLEKRYQANSKWLAGDSPTIADVACYSHVASAEEGGVDLGSWSHVQSWMQSMEKLPRFLPFPYMK